MDLAFALSAIIFTLLAIVVATWLYGGSSPAAGNLGHRGQEGAAAGFVERPKQNGHLPEEEEEVEEKKKEKKNAAAAGDWCEISGSSHDHWDVVKCVQSTEGATESPEIADEVDPNSDNSLKYVPGKARSHHFQMMMSKEELEEEQRVQREQLAAIFQLLKDNTETFGEVSDGDMDEQLKLYSI